MKFKIYESVITEAFDPSMPEAIRKWLVDGSRSKWNNKIRTLTYDLGVDLSTAKFEEVPIPTTNRDPFFKLEGKIKAYDFGDKGIYIEGVNGDAEFLRPDGKYQPGKWLPAKAIMGMAKHIYLIEPSDEANPNVKKLNRLDAQKAGKEFRRYSPEQVSNSGWDPYVPGKRSRWTTQVDKSGYIVDPNRLEKKLVQSGIFNPGKKVEKAYQDLLALRNDISSLFADVASGNRMDSELFGKIGQAANYASTAANYYNRLMDYVEKAEREKQSSPTGKLDPNRIKWYRNGVDGALISLNDYVQYSRREIQGYLGTMVDWDTDEDDI